MCATTIPTSVDSSPTTYSTFIATELSAGKHVIRLSDRYGVNVRRKQQDPFLGSNSRTRHRKLLVPHASTTTVSLFIPLA